MNYWILSLPREDMERCVEVGTFGLNRKFSLGQVQIGDKVACCASKEWKIIALGEATSEYYLDTEKIFRSDGLFPDRFKFAAKRLSNEEEIHIVNFLDKLSFVKNLAYWGVYFRSAITRVSKSDWELICGEVEKVRI